MVTRREQAIRALEAKVASVMPSGLVQRGGSPPATIPAGGLAIMQEAELPEPEVTLGVLSWYFDMPIDVEVYIQDYDGQMRSERLDSAIEALTKILQLDPTLGGVVDWAVPHLNMITHRPWEGAEAVGAASIRVTLSFEGSGPTG